MKIVAIFLLVTMVATSMEICTSRYLLVEIEDENQLQCDNAQRINSRIGGPDSCIVKPHSKPWMAKLILSDRGSIVDKVRVISEASKNETVASQMINMYEKLIIKWKTYFQQDVREKVEKLFVDAKKAMGNTKAVQEIIKNLPETQSFADNTVHTVEAHRCGGSLITKRHVLTAAHCVCTTIELRCIALKNCTEHTECTKWKNYGVVLGDHDTTIDDGEKIFQFESTIVDEKMRITKKDGLIYDFAIILLHGEVALSEKINVIQLPSEDITCPSGMQFIATGWGRDRYKNQDIPFDKVTSTRFLQAVNMDCLDFNECYDYGNNKPSAVFCVGDRSKRKNSICAGDSGGPLILTENGITKLYGVASFTGVKDEGDHCLISNAVYGRVSEPATLKWIRSNIKSFF